MKILQSSSKKNMFACLSIAFASFFLLAGYEFVRSVTKPLFIKAYSVEALPTVMILIPVATFIYIYVYGFILSLLGPARTLIVITLGSGIVMEFLRQGILLNIPEASALLFLFRAAYVVIIIEQYWSFVNSTLNVTEAKKVNGFVLGISSIGAVVGGIFASQFATTYGSISSIMMASILMLPAALFSYLAYKIGGESKTPKRKLIDSSGTSLLIKSSYLRKIAGLILFSQIIAGLFDLRFWDLISKAIVETDAQSSYYAKLYVIINSSAMFCQFILAPILGAILSLRWMLIMVPSLNFIAAIFLLSHPTLLFASSTLILFKVLDYSLFRTSKEPLYIPLSFDERYRTKQVIDSFIYRFAKGSLTGGLISLWTRIGARIGLRSFIGAGYSIIAMSIAIFWMLTAYFLAKEHDEIKTDQ